MTYFDTFYNTLFTDVLEYAGVVKIPSNFKVQTPATTQAKEDAEEEKSITHKRSNSGDIEAVVESEQVLKSTIDEEEKETREQQIPVNDSDDLSDHKKEIDPFLVDWNGPDDPEHPQNWHGKKKGFIVVQVMLLTCSTYMGSSIYTPGQQEIQDVFNVGHVVGTLNLSLFVLGYGIGPMVFSPLSETPSLGRNHIYMATLFLFALMQIPAALSPTIGGLIVSRFIAGVLSSPSISTGGATLGDFITPQILPLFIGLWAVGAVAAPVIAPLLGAAMVIAKDYRYIFWLLMAICSFTFLLLTFFFPETLPANILHRRAKRIRAETGDNRYYTKDEVAQKDIHIKAFLKELFFRPFAIMFSEPGVMSFNLYIALAYGCFYLFFEAYPIVFIGIYNFTLIQLGLAYFGFCVGCIFAYMLFLVYLTQFAVPRFQNNTFKPETFLVLAMWVCFLLPASLFLFGWTAHVHWILPILWEIPFVMAVFNIFQSSFAFLSMSYVSTGGLMMKLDY